MALVLSDRVKETTTSTGTSDFTLGGAVTGFQTFSAGVGNSNTTYYAVSLGADWEVGLGTLSSDGLTLARTTVLQSSNSDTKVSFAAGSKEVFVTYAADKAVFEDASGNVTLPANLTVTGGSTTDSVQLDLAASVTPAVGQIAWDSGQGTAILGLLGGNIISRLGQSLVAYVTNAESVTITKGQAVYLFSAQGDRATVKLANNTGDATSAKTLGIVGEDITANGTGFVVCQGVAYGLNLSAFTAGDTLYLGSTAGAVTATKPYAPNHLVYLGVVEKANAGAGQLYVRVQNGYEMDELHNVSAQSPTTGQTLVYNSSTSLWEKNTVSLTAGVNGTLPVANGGTGITSLGTGVATFLGTPSSANLLAAVTDETGTGSLVFATSPTLVTPTLGTPASATLTNATGLPIATGVSGLGTGVATALAVNVGTAGSAIINGGDLGTPLSGTLTNCTFPTLNQNTTGTAANVAGTVAIANGGTGATSSGAALTSLGAQATLVSGTNIKTINSTSLLGSGDISVSGVVQYAQNIQSANYTLVIGDAGKQIFHPASDTSTRDFTIPANSSVAFPIGTVFLFTVENGGRSVDVLCGDTLILGDNTTGTVAVLANNTLMCIKVTATKWMANYLYQAGTARLSEIIAVAHSTTPFISAYPLSSTGFGTKFADPATLPTGNGSGVAFTSTGNAIAVAHSISPFISAYPFSGNGFGTKFANPATLPASTAGGVAFTSANNAIAVAHDTTPFVSAYPWSGSGFGTKFANPATLPTGNGEGVAFTSADDAIAVAHAITPFITAYPWSGSGFGIKFANPATLPSTTATSVAFNPAGTAIAVAARASPNVLAYPWSGSGFGTKFADPATLPTSDGFGVAFNPAGDAIAVAHETSPCISVYPWSVSGFGTKFTNPATIPTGTGRSVAFTSAGDAIAVAHTTTPFVSAYPWSGSGFGTKFADPATLPTGNSSGVAFSTPF
jgi:hypothetical protein